MLNKKTFLHWDFYVIFSGQESFENLLESWDLFLISLNIYIHFRVFLNPKLRVSNLSKRKKWKSVSVYASDKHGIIKEAEREGVIGESRKIKKN